jgi:hypothetical protein
MSKDKPTFNVTNQSIKSIVADIVEVIQEVAIPTNQFSDHHQQAGSKFNVLNWFPPIPWLDDQKW